MRDPENSSIAVPGSRPPIPLPAVAAIGVCLVALLAHISWHSFLCDDAFISFRYARNLAEGHGLVFNPGFERVEGYTNFLWVVILAGARLLGLAPERAANPLSVACAIVLVLVILAFCRRHAPPGAGVWWLVVPAGFLATQRSFAVWSTSGLETKLFELLAVSGVLRTLDEMGEGRLGGGREPFPWSMALFALATLTRPDGLLIAASVVGTRLAFQLSRRGIGLSLALKAAALFAVPVGGHFLFRRLYYGAWLPNTYYVKIGGATWWSYGWAYLGAFALEYAAFLWIPLFILAASGLRRSGRSEIFWITLAAILPHALYVAAIGGDHFEFRPLDLYLPLIAVLLYFGMCWAAALGRARAAVIYLVLVIGSSLLVPVLSRLDFPADYRACFPGLTPRDDQSQDLIDRTRHPQLFATPLIGRYLTAYNALFRTISRHFVGLRREEHAAFLATVVRQGGWLADMLANGTLPHDAYLAVSCVGAIPYLTDLRILDRFGLTDSKVARQPAKLGADLMMAHQKVADIPYGRERGVDLWAADLVYPLLPAGHPGLGFYAYLESRGVADIRVAEAGSGRYLVIFPISAPVRLAERFPRLDFRPARTLLDREWGSGAAVVPREAQIDVPYDRIYVRQGQILLKLGHSAAARLQFERAVRANPLNGTARQLLIGLATPGGRS